MSQMNMVKDGLNPLATQSLKRAIQFQPYCEYCLMTPTDSESGEYRKFIPCRECNMAFFCSEQCRTTGMGDHVRKQCAQLQELAFTDVFKSHHFKETGETKFMLPVMDPKSEYKPLESIKSWKQYYEELSGHEIGAFITDDFQPAQDDAVYNRGCRIAKIAADSASTYSLTILSGLESTVVDLPSREHLTIHLVGADETELTNLRATEDFLHLLPNLRSITVGCIGPELPVEGEGHDDFLSLECCPKCKSDGRTRRIFGKRKLYHDFMKSSLYSKSPPDLIVAFHSGHADRETSSWTPSLRRILDLNVPAIFTTYNETEAFEEEQALNALGACFVKTRSENRWRGAIPYSDVMEERYQVFYTNYYWYIVRGRTGAE